MKSVEAIEQLRQEYQKDYDYYYKAVDDYISKYGEDDSEYIKHKKALMFYTKGALSALNKILEI